MPTFSAYDVNIPIAANPPSTSPPGFQGNFSDNANLINIDHIGFKQGNGGCHRQTTYVNLLAPPTGLAGAVTEYALGTELFFKRNTGGAPIQLTTSSGNPVAAATGQTFLPGGIILKWGTANNANNAVALGFPANAWNVQLTVANPNADIMVVVRGIAAGSFNYWIQNRNGSAVPGLTVYWMAIGN
jgi:hypothetical protein